MRNALIVAVIAAAGFSSAALAEGKVVGVWEVQQSAEGILLLKRVEGLPLGPAQELRAR